MMPAEFLSLLTLVLLKQFRATIANDLYMLACYFIKNVKSYENPMIMSDKGIYSHELLFRTDGKIWT